MARKLVEMDVAEISLVDKSANRRKFFIKKQDRRKIMKWIEILKSFFGEDNLTEDDVAKAELMPEERAKEIGEALEVFQKYEVEDFPQDIHDASKTLAKFASISPLVEKAAEAELDAETIIAKAGASLSKATKAQLEKIKTIVDGLLKTKEEKAKADGTEKLPPDVVAKLDELEDRKKKEKAALEKAVEEKEKARTDEIEDLKKKVDELSKRKGVKKGLEDTDEDDDEVKKKDAVPKWNSLDIIATDEK